MILLSARFFPLDLCADMCSLCVCKMRTKDEKRKHKQPIHRWCGHGINW